MAVEPRKEDDANSADEPVADEPVADEPVADESSQPSLANIPPLWKDSTFHGLNLTQFLGAFNDNVFKQLLLLLAVGGAAAAANAEQAGEASQADLQGVALFCFAIPFLMFSGIAGYLSEVNSKRDIVVASKSAEILVMLLGMGAFAIYGWVGLPGLFFVLFCMGAQSAIFGPSKYGILPEVLHSRDLPRANGVFLMMTFLAIIFGTAVAGALGSLLKGRLWIASGVCVVIAVVGTIASLLVRRPKPAEPTLRLTADAFFIPKDVRTSLRMDRGLLVAILICSCFWFVGGMVQPAVNALGRRQLGVDELWTSLLNAAVGVGIAAGCVLAGKLSNEQVNFHVMRAGAIGIVACLAMLIVPLSMSILPQQMTYAWSLGVLLAAGVFTGMFVIPLQVFVQTRPPPDQRGRVIATLNFCNWIFICAAALVYTVSSRVVEQFAQPQCLLFIPPLLVMVPIAIFYHPKDLALPED